MFDQRKSLLLSVLIAFLLVLGLAPATQAAVTGTGTLSGVVTDTDGNPLADVSVSIWRVRHWGCCSQEQTVLTGADGSYAADLPATARYRVCFTPADTAYAAHCAGGERLHEADTFQVIDGGAAVRDAKLQRYGHLRGTVADMDNIPLQGINVEPQVYNETYDGWDGIDGSLTGVDGTYDVAVLPGTYRLRFEDYSDAGYLGEYFDDVASVWHATDLVVGEGDVLSGKDAELARSASISGTVTLPVGAKRGEGLVRIFNTDINQYVAGTQADKLGHFAVSHLDAGSYRVEFDRVSGFALGAAQFSSGHPESDGNGSADLITLTAGEQVTGIDATIALGGRITGSLTDTHGNPLAGCRLVASTTDGSLIARTGTSDGDGAFVVPGLSTGDYLLKVRGRGLCDGGTQFFAGAGDPLSLDRAAGTTVHVTLGEETVLDPALVYTRGGQISGTVTLPEGSFGSDRIVRVVDTATGHGAGRTRVHADGTYTLTGLAPGSYRLEFARISGTAFSAAQFFHGHAEGDGAGTSETLTVGLGDIVAGNDDTLVQGGSITGTLTDTQGAPLDSCRVLAYTEDGSLVTRSHRAELGTFTIGGLATGDYLLKVAGDWACDGGAQFFTDAGGVLTTTQHGSIAVSVTVGNATTIDTPLQYAVGGRITGHVDLPSGALARDGFVRVVGPDGEITTSIDELGDYSVGGLGAGTYRVEFSRISGQAYAAAQFFDGTPESDGEGAAAHVDVQLGHTVELVNGAPVAGGSVAGTLVDGSDAPLAGCLVQAWTADGHLVTRSAKSAADGSFSIGGLSTGDYLVRVVPSWSSHCNAGIQYAAGSGGALVGRTSAEPVSVTLGSAVVLDPALVYGASATIKGTLTLPDGALWNDAHVAIVDADTGDIVSDRFLEVGRPFSISGLAPGSYRVEFDRSSGEALGAAEFYDNVAEGDGVGEAHLVDLAPGQVATGIDATIKVGGSFSGTLVDADGNPLRCTVDAFTQDGTLVARTTRSNADGTFTLGGLSTGQYNLSVRRAFNNHDCADGEQYYTGSDGRLGADVAGAVTIGATRGVDVPVAHALIYSPGELPPTIGSSGPPAVTGDAIVGRTLTATAGTWSEPDVTTSIRWLADGTPIDGATGPTLDLTSALVGKAISVRVTASKAGFADGVATSVPTSAVVLPELHNTGVPTITGNAVVGQTLTAGTGTWSEPGVSTAVKWLADGTPIDGATGTTLDLTTVLVGKAISARVTASKTDWVNAVATSAATSAVALPTVVNNTAPSISGDAVVGETLTAQEGIWSPADVTFTYQWLADDVAIGGATSSTYIAVAGDEGKVLSVAVTGAKTDHTSASATSAGTAPIAAAPLPVVSNSIAPTITGTAKVGKVLTAHAGTWDPADVSLAYQWSLNGIPVAGASGGTLKLAPTAVGKTVTVTVTASRTGYTGAAATSAPTAKVVKGKFTVTKPPRIKGTPVVGKLLKVVAAKLSPSASKITYQWLRNGKKILHATRASYKLVKGDRHARISLKVTYVRTGYTTLVIRTGKTAPVS